jgi:hypothetical protein
LRQFYFSNGVQSPIGYFGFNQCGVELLCGNSELGKCNRPSGHTFTPVLYVDKQFALPLTLSSSSSIFLVEVVVLIFVVFELDKEAFTGTNVLSDNATRFESVFNPGRRIDSHVSPPTHNSITIIKSMVLPFPDFMFVFSIKFKVLYGVSFVYIIGKPSMKRRE